MEFLKIWEILIRRKWIIAVIFSIFLITGFIGVRLVTPIYKSEAKLLVQSSDTASSLLSTLGLSSLGGNMMSTTENYDTEIALAKISPLLEELITSLDLRNRKGEPMKPTELVEQNFVLRRLFPKPYLKVEQYEDSDMLEVIATSPDPKQAAAISNKLAELYIAYRLQQTREEYKAARLFIESKILSVKEDYYKSLIDIRDFKLKTGTVDLSIEGQNLINKVATLKGNYEDNEKTIVNAEKSMVEARSKLNSIEMYRKETKEFSQSDSVKSLKTKLNELLLSITEKSVNYTKEHPEYKKLDREVETIKALLKDEATMVFNGERFSVDPVYDQLSKSMMESYIELEGGLAKRKLIQKYIDQYQGELLKIPVKNVENSKLDLALSVNKDMYQKLLEYMTQVGVAESMTLSDIRLVELASVSDKPYFPKKLLSYMLSASMGLFWSLAAAFFVEYIDNTVKTPEDIKHVKPLTLLGTVPRSKFLRNRNMISNLDPTLPIVEGFRTVRNSVRYASVDKQIKILAVTSSVESEGKSSNASNLATTFSMEDKKVILVDLDLRRPSLHKFFKISNRIGVTNVLAEGMKLEDAIIKTGVQGLDILPSGPVPPDPSRLIGSQKIKDIITTLAAQYDMVIIDTPPVMAVNDAIVIGRSVDSVIYVIEAGKTTFAMVERVKEIVAAANINLVGCILNKFKMQGRKYNYYYYSSGYKNVND
ncbi:MAG: polysaccharide biosynthesis tyrosine autokinase [Deltaproteobacteria bacterium]|nr:polysaccharide biosynthesis tyrosine autokinase [Deltaproteobacteria bacterium]